MATIKSYSDLQQSKKLAEILPIESADMWFANGIIVARNSVNEPDDIKSVSPCWSLAALLSVLPNPSLHKIFSGWRCDSDNKEWTSCILGEPSDNPVDACVKTILKLHELKSCDYER